MLKKIIAFCVLFTFLFQTFCFASPRSISINDVRNYANENCSEAKDVILDRITKEIELKQAKDAIKDIRKKESTVKFSLLFNIELPSKHGMPKEIELIMKVPKIQNEITVLQKQENYERLKNKQKAESAFYDVLLENYNTNYATDRIADSSVTLKDITRKYQTGDGKKEDVDYVQNQIDGFKTKQKSSILNLNNKKKSLGNIINLDVTAGYDFQEYFPETNITRDMLPQIIEYSKQNDFELFKKTQARKLAEKNAYEILQIYKSKYSKYIGDIESYINSHKDTEIDYEDFIKKYNYTLYQIDSPWYGSYVINLLFFKIYIPKEWFKWYYSGTRYMEDQKYALFVALAEKDKAVKAEKDAITSLENSIYDAYNNLKQMESSYKSVSEEMEKIKIDYEQKKQKNKMGLLSFSSLESVKDSFYEKQSSAYEMKMSYAKALSSFNLTTSGYIDKLLSGGSFSSSELESGTTFADKATWYIKNPLTEYNFEFGVNIPEEYGVNYYQLFYDNQPIGDMTATDKPIIHSPLTYNDTSLLEVRLYKDGKLKYTASFDAGQYDGELDVKAVSDNSTAGSSDVFAKYTITDLDSLRKEFKVSDVNAEYTDFEVFSGDVSIGKASKNNSIATLGLYFSDLEKLKIVFYNGQSTVFTGKLTDIGTITSN